MGKSNKLVKIIVAVGLLFFLIYQYYVGVYAAIQTESAIYFEHTEGIDTVATVIRSEKTIASDHNGTLHFLISNGEKVAKDGKIANIYANDSASAAASRITEIEQQLSLISEIEGYNDSTAVDVNTINAKISNCLDTIVYSSQDGRYKDVDQEVSELLTLMTRKQVITGEQSDFGALKEALKAEKDNLATHMGAPTGSLTTDTSGYFISVADGYEGMLITEDLSVYTPEYLTSIKPDIVPQNVIGKIVYDYEWYLAAPVSLNDSRYYKIGDTVSVKTDTASSPRLRVTVSAINISKSGDDAVLILRCNEMNSELASLRSGMITIIKRESSGIRINSDALRVVDGVNGVYVVSGLEAKFVKTELVYSCDEYSLCELNTADSSKLRLYDEILVKGKNLYDGKIIY